MSSTIKSLAKNIPGLKRVKSIKDLLFQKLDDIIRQLNDLINTSNEVKNTSKEVKNLLFSLRDNSFPLIHTILNGVNETKNLLLQLINNSLPLIDITLNTSKEIKAFLLDRVKSSFDRLENAANVSLENDSVLLRSSLEINNKSNALLENDRSLTEASIKIVNILQENREKTSQQNELFIEAIQQICYQNEQQFNYLKEEIIKEQIKALQERCILERRVDLISDRYNLLNPETGLMAHLYSYLPSRNAIDVGANLGDVSECLLKAGYQVYAFEPYNPVFEKLKNRFNDNSDFHCYQLALGEKDETRELHIAVDRSVDRTYQDATLYNSLTKHSMPENLVFTDTVSVEVRSLNSLYEKEEIPDNIGIVKIDTEGFDLEVIRGMGNNFYPVVVAEFWDEKSPLGRSGANNKLSDMVKEMKQKNYHWHIVLYRVWGQDKTAFYANYSESVENSWGNVFFFQDYQVFSQALMWCHSALPVTYFTV